MNFEEFLLKKKIDPVQLQSAEPSLFSEFSFHYKQMGERSFDHSKKFWFNKLRRKYHLEEVPKITKSTDEPNRIAEQAEPLLSPSIQATGYTPGITSSSSSIEPQSPEKPAYKPRFKAPVQPQDPSSQSEGVSPEAGQVKPVYKPRFKAQLIEPSLKKEKPEEKPEETRPEPEQPKPAYKPRFKPGLIPPKKKEED